MLRLVLVFLPSSSLAFWLAGVSAISVSDPVGGAGNALGCDGAGPCKSAGLAGRGGGLHWLVGGSDMERKAYGACAPGVAVQGYLKITVCEGHIDLRYHGHCTRYTLFLAPASWAGPFG